MVGASCGSGRRRRRVLTDAAHPAHEAGAQPPLLPGEMPPLHHPSPGWGALGPGKAASGLLGKGLWWHHQLPTLGVFSAAAPPTAPLPTPGAGTSPSSCTASPQTPSSPQRLLPLFCVLLPVLPACPVPHHRDPNAGKAARKAPREEGAELLPLQQAPGLFSLALFSS